MDESGRGFSTSAGMGGSQRYVGGGFAVTGKE